jgi:hypothetical protein
LPGIVTGSNDERNGAGQPMVPLHVLPPAVVVAEGEGDPAYLGLAVLGPVPGERRVREHALVLQSMRVWHVIKRTPAGWVLLVRDADFAAASEGIRRYEAENADWPPSRAWWPSSS